MKDKRRKNFHTYEQAQILLKQEHIQSEVQYKRWMKMYKPKGFPVNPVKTYQHQWQGWSAFLQSNNTFPIKKKWMGFKEAWAIARQSPCRTKNEWWEWKDRPDTIPYRPDLIYRGYFLGWKSWLGTQHKPADAILQKKLEQSQPEQSKLFYVGYNPDHQTYMLSYNRDDLASCRQMLAWVVDDAKIVNDIITRHCSGQGFGEYLIGNVQEFLFEMDTTFERHSQLK